MQDLIGLLKGLLNSFAILGCQVDRVDDREENHTRREANQYRCRFMISWGLRGREQPAVRQLCCRDIDSR